MDWKLEVVVVPVSDVDRAKEFYAEKVGFNLDHDTQVSANHRVIQLTPPGSACSIVIQSRMPGADDQPQPGSLKGLQLVVSDIRAAREELAARGVPVSEVQVLDDGEWRPARDGDSLDYQGFCFFRDPDGNSWAVQQIDRG